MRGEGAGGAEPRFCESSWAVAGYQLGSRKSTSPPCCLPRELRLCVLTWPPGRTLLGSWRASGIERRLSAPGRGQARGTHNGWVAAWARDRSWGWCEGGLTIAQDGPAQAQGVRGPRAHVLHQPMLHLLQHWGRRDKAQGGGVCSWAQATPAPLVTLRATTPGGRG